MFAMDQDLQCIILGSSVFLAIIGTSWMHIESIGAKVFVGIIAVAIVITVIAAMVETPAKPPRRCIHHHSNCSCRIEQQQKHYCPICGSSDTETDSLAIHCNDCGRDLSIENESARAYFCPDCGSKAEFVAADGDTVTLHCDDCGQERQINQHMEQI